MGGRRNGSLASGLSARRRRLGSAGLALILLTLVLPAFADAPQTGTDPSVALNVSPSTGLSDGQVVTVTGTGFPANTVGTIRECGGTVAAPQCDLTTTTPFVTTAAGTIPPTAFTTKRIVNTGATTFNCGVQACAVVATAGAKSAQHQIRMAGAGTVVTSSSTTTSSATTSTTTSSPTSSSTTTSSVPGSTTSSTTTSTAPATTTSTRSPVPTNPVQSSTCEPLRRSQGDARATLDALIAAFPEFRDVGARAREATNARFEQALAAAGC